MARPRILYFVHAYAPLIGGLESVSEDLLRALPGRGYDVTVLTGRDDAALPASEDVDGVAVRRVDLREALIAKDPGRVLDARRALAAIFAELRPQLVHAPFAPLTAYYAVQMLRASPVPLLVAFHGIWPGVTGHPDGLAARMLARAAWTTACSQAVLEDVWSFAPQVRDRSSRVPNGMDPPPDGPAAPPAGPPVIAGIGRLSPEKGFDVLLHALAAVRARRPDVRLRLAGDGPMRPALEAQSAALGLTGAVDFLGWIDRRAVAAVIDAASVVAVPSHSEGFGLVALEAALRGRAVVASRVGGLPEVVGGRDTGALVAADDAEALAAALLAMIDDPAHARAVGAAARRRAAQRFPAALPVDAYDALYRRLLAAAA
jgi:glycosyltransferase involved in cell wall biosynthesis